jgi:hypothetical protein
MRNSRKTILLVFLCLAFVLAATSSHQTPSDKQIQAPRSPQVSNDWDAAGEAVCSATGDQNYPRLVSDGLGGAIIVWRDWRGIYAQRTDVNGTMQWTTDGVAVCSLGVDHIAPRLVEDGAGGAIITWYDARSGHYDIWAQRLNASGIPQWTTNGVGICLESGDQYYPEPIPDGAGGAIISWADRRSGSQFDVYVQRINAAGIVQWTAGGVVISNGPRDQSHPQIVSDGASGAIVTFEDFDTVSDTDIRAQRVDGSGVPQWTPGGVGLATTSANQFAPVIASDGAGGAIVAWHDQTFYDYNLWARRVSAAGTVLWTAALCMAENDQAYPRIVSDGANGAIVAWTDDRNEVTTPETDVYAQRVDASGNVLWTPDGELICGEANLQFLRDVISDGSDGAVLVWSDERNGSWANIYAQHLNGWGNQLWTPGGYLVSPTSGADKGEPALVSDALGGTIIAYRATHTDRDIDAQRLRWKFVVTNTNDSGPGSLRQAILDANANGDGNYISFDIPGPGPHSIAPTSALPDVNTATVIDGYTQPGSAVNTNGPGLPGNAVIMVELNGMAAGVGWDGLRLMGGSVVRGLAVNFCNFAGIRMAGDGNTVAGCYLGTDVTGTLDYGNVAYGVVSTGANNVIGGRTPDARNVICGNNAAGVLITTGASENWVIGNFIGTDVTGATALPNLGHGVAVVDCDPCYIGDDTDEEINVISGNVGNGVYFDVSTQYHFVHGNLIGTDVTGTAPLGNTGHGVRIEDLHSAGAVLVSPIYQGTTPVIAYNGGDGVSVNSATAGLFSVELASIYDNGGLGINLEPDTLPDAPVITEATTNGSSVVVTGTVEGAYTSGNSWIHYYLNNACDPSGYGEGEEYFHTLYTYLNVGVPTPFTETVPDVYGAAGRFVTAALTSAYPTVRNSEFSACVEITNTPVGSDVLVFPYDETTGTTPVRVAYETVTDAGATTLETSDTGPPVPGDYIVGDEAVYYHIETTASHSGVIEVCITYDEAKVPQPEADLLLLHWDESLDPDDWAPITTSLNTAINVICGETTLLSPFVICVPDTATAVAEPASPPAGPALHQNVPNPFNPTTTIAYDVPSGDDVQIVVYDVTGRRIRTLVNGYNTPGPKSVVWDARDDEGRAVASGIYFYRMTAGDFVQTRKMLLLK